MHKTLTSCTSRHKRCRHRIKMRRKLLFAAACTAAMVASAAENSDDSFSYKPDFHGALRTRYEVETQTGDMRFQVRNARFSVSGFVARPIDYFFQVDLCDRGVIKALDFWARIKIAKGFSVQAGQFRMPFGTDPFRAPSNYIFSNRSFIGKYMCNVRAVGVKAMYTFSNVPLRLEAGVFNPYTIANHDVWSNTMAFAGKAVYTLGNVNIAGGFQSIEPGGTRTNLVDGSLTWSFGRWLLEGEYMYKHYTNKAYKACHGYNAYAQYTLPIEAGLFSKLAFEGRVDGMTTHRSASSTEARRNRITIGSTISYLKSKYIFVDIRADYEKYFYHSSTEIPQGREIRLL